MAIVTVTYYVAVCDVCGCEYDGDSEYGNSYRTPHEALEAATMWDPTTAYTRTVDGRLICHRDTADHHEARTRLASGPGQLTIV